MDASKQPGPTKPATPKPSATVILLRDGAGSGEFEVLMVQRNPNASFMGGAWVFPGGTVCPEDGSDPDQAHRVAALRELAEEADIFLSDPAALVPFSRWITPAQVPIRFDTRFYLATAPPNATPEPDGDETVDVGWFTPSDALRHYKDGKMNIVFPTIKHLEKLERLATPDEAFAVARASKITPVEPRVVERDGHIEIVLPGEPGFDDSGSSEEDYNRNW